MHGPFVLGDLLGITPIHSMHAADNMSLGRSAISKYFIASLCYTVFAVPVASCRISGEEAPEKKGTRILPTNEDYFAASCLGFDTCELECPAGATFKRYPGGSTKGTYSAGCFRLGSSYSGGSNHGPVVRWNNEGEREYAEFLLGKDDGVRIVWNRFGTKVVQQYRSENQLHGPHSSWYASGAIAVKGGFYKGRVCGLWRCWRESGELQPCDNVVDGEINPRNSLGNILRVYGCEKKGDSYICLRDCEDELE